MASTYVNDLRLNEMATGDASGSWGTVTNTNLELIGEALGYGTEAITTNADTHTSTIADGASDPIRAIFIKYTGTLDSACTITIGPNTVNKFCFIHNATSGSQSIIISQGSGANVTIATGQTKGVYLDGAGSGAAVVDGFATLSVGDLLVDDDMTVTDDLTVGGIVSLADGTAGAPSLTNTGDVNAGLFFSAADTLAFSAGGTAQFTMADGVIAPVTDSDVDLGTSSLYFKNSYIDTVTTTGAITAGGNITRGGTVISDGAISDTGDFTVDVAGDIILNADGGDIHLEDGAVRFGSITKDGNDFKFNCPVADGDIKFVGNDNGVGAVTALTLDMSAAGAATFNSTITTGGTVISDGAITEAGNLTLDAGGDIILDAGGQQIILKDDGTTFAEVYQASNNLYIESKVSDKDIFFRGNDGGSDITALTLDMSAAGAATFNNDVTAFSDERLKSNITTIPDALSKVTEMRGVHYVRDATGKDSTGVIAQEMQKVAPELVLTADDEMGTLSVNYGNITGYLIEAIKELKAEIEELKAR